MVCCNLFASSSIHTPLILGIGLSLAFTPICSSPSSPMRPSERWWPLSSAGNWWGWISTSCRPRRTSGKHVDCIPRTGSVAINQWLSISFSSIMMVVQVFSDSRSGECRVDCLLRRSPAGVEGGRKAFRQGIGKLWQGHPCSEESRVLHDWLPLSYSGGKENFEQLSALLDTFIECIRNWKKWIKWTSWW